MRAVVLGLGLVVSAGLAVPPASATDAVPADVPTASVDGTAHVQLTAAPVPPDLDLSGARFAVLGPDGSLLGSCDTDASGRCDVPLATYAGTPGTFRLVQDAGRPVPGLVPSAGVLAFGLCSPGAADCPSSPSLQVGDASLFRTSLAVTVRDAGTGTPVSGVGYSLTGPGYRSTAVASPDAGAAVLPDPAVSGHDGRVTFTGWFLPGDWALTPEVTPHGYRSSGVVPVTLPARLDGSDSWSTVLDLAADVPDLGSGGGSVPRVPPPAPHPGPPPAPAPAPPPAPLPHVVNSSVAPRSTALPSPAPAAPAAPAAPSTAAPDTSDLLSMPPASGPALVPPPQDPPPVTAGTTPIRTAAVTSSQTVGLAGVGVLLVTLVVFGVGYLRRRLRTDPS